MGDAAGAMAHALSSELNLELTRKCATSTVSLPDEVTGDWQESVRQIAMSYWESCSTRRRLIPLLTSHAVHGLATLRIYDASAEVLEQAGFDPKRRPQAIAIIDSFVLGSALGSATPSAVWCSDVGSSPVFKKALPDGLSDTI